MSGFVRNLYDDSLFVRQQQAFQGGDMVAGTVVNPANIVFFNPAASGVFVLLYVYEFATTVASDITMFELAADPALAAGVQGRGRALGTSLPKAIFEFAVAAVPTNVGQLGRLGTPAGMSLGPLPNNMMRISAGRGISFSTTAVAANIWYNFAWYEITV